MKKYLFGVISILLLLGICLGASAEAVRNDTNFNTNTFDKNDDGYISVDTGIDFNFFGLIGPDLYLNNNGNVTFGDGLSRYTPTQITAGSIPMIAPFFADVDTRGSSSEPVRYGNSTVGGHNAFGINWINVGHYNEGTPLNSFQLVLINRSDIAAGDFDFEFNYNSILWEAGTASGSNSSGLGGTSAHVGYTNGNGTYYEFPGSGVNGALLDSGPAGTSLIQNSLNSDVDGRYLFQVRNSNVINPVNPAPEPATMLLLGFGIIGLTGFRRKFKK